MLFVTHKLQSAAKFAFISVDNSPLYVSLCCQCEGTPVDASAKSSSIALGTYVKTHSASVSLLCLSFRCSEKK